MITLYDYFIIGFYFVFILAVGMIFRRQSKSTSDYFRAGGSMPWWITGTSAWIAGFSAWTFTGAAGKVYETGTLVLWLYYSSILGLAITYLYTCRRYRRMRVVTWMEAVRQRYGPVNEQLYTWLKLPLQLLFSGVGLNAVGVFMSSVFHMDMVTVLLILGAAVTLVAVTGGAWAVLASDFVQMFLVMTITIVVAFLVLRLPAVGGLTGLAHQVPSYHFHWAELARPQIIGLWAMVMVWNGVASNSFENSTMYLMSKSDTDARRMVLIPLFGSLIGPLIWFIPSMAATITHPNLAAEFPHLRSPHEAAFVAVCMDVLPKGLLGLLVCAMLGATLTSMDAGLNKGAGVFVRSVYLPYLNRNCPEKRLLLVSKVCTLVFGVIIVTVAVQFSKFRTMGLFDLTNQLGASLALPLSIPLIWGLFYKKTPVWSAWSTVLVGYAMSYLSAYIIKPEMFQHLMGWQTPLSSKREVGDFTLFTTVFLNVGVCSAWFFLTSLFYKTSSAEHHSRVEQLFLNMRTPINAAADGIKDYDTTMYRLIGGLCLIYGAFILLLVFIPNTGIGRLCFVFCGGALFLAGGSLYALSRRTRLVHPTLEEELVTGEPLEDEAALTAAEPAR